MLTWHVVIATALMSQCFVYSNDTEAGGSEQWRSNDAMHGNVRMGVKSEKCDDAKVYVTR